MVRSRPLRLAAYAVVVFSAATYATCSDEGSTGPGSATDTTTSATPGVAAALLGPAHEGWRKVSCLAAGCHRLTHGGNAPAGCTVCHGTNGADRMKTHPAHAKLGDRCGGCHSGVHAGVTLADPVDCATCHKFEATAACPATHDVDVVVIGAGGGGLAAAAGLARAGKRVVVIEKHYKVGGYMTSFKRGPYTFEVSLHGFDGLDPGGMNQDIFKLLGIWEKVKPVKEPIMYRVEYPGFRFEVPQKIDDYRAALKQRFPKEAAGIDAIFDAAGFVDGFLRQYTDYEAGRTTTPPPLEDLLRFQDYCSQPLSKFLDEHVRDPLLVSLWTQLVGFAGTEPARLSTAYFLVMWSSYHLHGYYTFVGGSQAVADAMAAVVRENGGTIRLGTLATRIAIEDGKAVHVETADDVCYRAKHVVSNASAPATIYKLVGKQHVAQEDLDRYGKWKVGLSAFVVYLGVDRDYSDVFGTTHEIMVSETLDPNQNFSYVEACDVEHAPFTLSNLTMVDPSTAPSGKNVIEITSQLSYDCGRQWGWERGHGQYKTYKQQMAAVLLRRAERLLEGLSQQIEVAEVASPMTLSQFTLNPRGSIFGWDNPIAQSMMNRMVAKQLAGIDNLYLVGAWAFPGGGQSAVLLSGLTAAQEILSSEKSTTSGTSETSGEP
jgi:all-trans-retinol 13,14-reductase